MDCMAARNLKIETNVLYDYLFYFCNMSHFYSYMVLVEGRNCKTMAFKISFTSVFLIEVVLVSLVCLPVISVTDLG